MIVPSCSEKVTTLPAAPVVPPAAPAVAVTATPPVFVPPPTPISAPPLVEVPPVVKSAPLPPARKVSPRLALAAAAVVVLLGVGGLIAARFWPTAAEAEPQTADAGQQNEPQQTTPATPPTKPAAPVQQAEQRPAEPKQAVALSPRRLNLTPAKPVKPERPVGGRLEQHQARVEEPPAAAAQPVAARPPAERRLVVPADELLRKLAWAPEVSLEGKGLTVFTSYLAHSKRHIEFENLPKQTDPSPLLGTVPRLKGLPFRLGPGCKLHSKDAGTLDELSRKLRQYLTRLTPAGPDGKRPDPKVLHETLRKELRGKKPEWLRPEAISTLMQILMHEDTSVRRMLVDLLAAIPGARATNALASRAVFDLDAEVRQAAVAALKKRDRSHYRPVFLRALRYPWAPAADHAAEALVALEDKAAVPELISLLKQPNPALPVTLNGRYTVVQELVRANHFTSCLMCHPPALQDNDPVIGIDPAVAIPFTLITATPSVQVQQGQLPVRRPQVGVVQQRVVRGIPAFLPVRGAAQQPARQQPAPQLPAPQQPARQQAPAQQAAGQQQQLPGALPAALGQSPFGQQLLKTAQRVAAQGGCHDYGAAAAGLSVSTQTIPTSGQAGSPLAQGVPQQQGARPQPGGGPRPVVPINFLRVGRRNVPFLQPGGGTVPILQVLPQLNFNVTSGAIPVLVRGDITYLRQDFSVVLPVQQAFLMRPLQVRYDFLVRTRVISQAEATQIRKEVGDNPSYPQREAVLFALRQLTGKDPGTETQAWLEAFPRAEQDVQAIRLGKQLVSSSGIKRENLLRKLRDSKGVVYTMALATAIPQLKGKFQERARLALVDRLTRMTPRTLRDKFRDDDAEVRRAAVAASQRKDKTELVPDLISLLDDPEPLTARAAEAALKDLTGQEHSSLADWQRWWQEQ
jgi:HEAT repeat protein